MDDTEENLEPQKKSQGNKTIILIAAVILITGLAMVLVPNDDKQSSGPSERGQLLQPMGMDAPAIDAPGIGEGVQARTYISQLRAQAGELDYGAAYREAVRMEKEEMPADAYLLYFFAARHGHPAASYKLATLADPSYQTPGQVNPSDPVQAHKWYKIALAAGVGEAEQRLSQLRKTVEQQAMAGDEKARNLVLQWK